MEYLKSKKKAVFAAQGMIVASGAPESFSALITSDLDHWNRVVKEAGIFTQ